MPDLVEPRHPGGDGPQTSGPSESLGATVLAQLAEASAYPEDESAGRGIDWIQTHISHVFLSPERVYKFRKAVDLGFLNFDSRAERNADCDREVALNRRLSPDVYLGVAPLLSRGHRHWTGPVSERVDRSPEAPEYCVVMRRLPSGRDALSLLEKGELSTEQLDRVAIRISGFHDEHSLGTPAPFSTEEWYDRCVVPGEVSFDSLMQAVPDILPRELLFRVRDAARNFARQHAHRFERRRRTGLAVDGHGDLHLQHIWFEKDDAPPMIIDCLEFNDDLRQTDAAAEVAFPAMDLYYRGHSRLAERFLRIYARERDDFDLFGVIDFFVSYRATVRAKVAALAARDSDIQPEQRTRAEESVLRHLELAGASLERRSPGSVIMVGGVVGTGKSSVANALADSLEGVVISSDRVRKRSAGLAPTEHRPAPPDTGIYTPAQTERVYSGLLERAGPVVASGRAVILDATYGRRQQRARVADWGHAQGVPVHFIETRCDPGVTLERLARRQAEGSDPSDAGPEFYAESVSRFEPRAEEESWNVVHTDRDTWRDALVELARDLKTRA